jgi:hypothetical protein
MKEMMCQIMKILRMERWFEEISLCSTLLSDIQEIYSKTWIVGKLIFVAGFSFHSEVVLHRSQFLNLTLEYWQLHFLIWMRFHQQNQFFRSVLRRGMVLYSLTCILQMLWI